MSTQLKTAGIFAAAAITLTAAAQTNLPPTASTPSATLPPGGSRAEKIIKEIKNPAPWISGGADLRVRNEYFNNALSLTESSAQSPAFAPVHQQDYFRYRGRVWVSILPTNDVTLNIRLAAEPREFMEPSTMDTYYGHEGMQWRYGIFDNLSVRWKKPLNLPATVTVGRQDIFLGDGWLVGDGTPEDGSFTTFLDSARVNVALDDLNTTIDAIGLIQDARPDGWLPTLGPSGTVAGDPEPYLLTDQNEKGAILWIANKTVPVANLDGYFIYKHDSRLGGDPQATFGDNADIFTVGGRLSGLVMDHWKYSAEGAYQFGRKQDPELNGQNGISNPVLAPSAQTQGFRNLDAFGVQSKLTYLFKDALNNQLSLAFEFLTGDNPNTKNDEMFDVLWGRWPQWSEMYNVYSYVQETRVGQTANLYRIGPTWSLSPMKNLDFSASYAALFADQDVPTRNMNETLFYTGQGPFSNDGNFRGHYFQAVLKYKFNAHLTGHLWGECLLPGDFYASNSTMSFLRAEIMYTF